MPMSRRYSVLKKQKTTMLRKLPLALVLVILAQPVETRADGDPVPTAAPEPPTHLGRFTRKECSPCVQETYAVKAVPVSSMKLPSFPGMQGAQSQRLGKISVEVVRAWELDRPTRELMAVRCNLLTSVAAESSQFFPLGAGMLDAEDAPDLVHAVEAISKAAAADQRDGPPDVIDIDYRVGSLRIGVLRSGGSAVGYVQVGDIALLSDRPVWQVPTTLYLATTDLQVLATALSDAIVQIRALRTQSGAL
jgi:hypothetical protein